MLRCNIPLLSSVILGALLATTSASPAGELLDHTRSLVARQTDPASCSRACQDALNLLTICANSQDGAGCLCPNGALLQQCINCSIVNNTGTVADANTTADSFNLICVGPGFSTAPLTVPAGSPPSSTRSPPGGSVTAPVPIPNSTSTPLPTPIPTPTTNQQITIGPSTKAATTGPSQSAPSMQGKAGMLTPSFEYWSLVVMGVALFFL